MINTNRRQLVSVYSARVCQPCKCLHARRNRRCMSWRCPMQLGPLTLTRTLLYVHARVDTVRRMHHIGDRHIYTYLQRYYRPPLRVARAHDSYTYVCSRRDEKDSRRQAFCSVKSNNPAVPAARGYTIRQPKRQHLDRTWNRAQISLRYICHSILKFAAGAFEIFVFVRESFF